MNITFNKLKLVGKHTTEELNLLLAQLSTTAKPLTTPLIKKILKEKNLELWVALDGKKIIGMGSIIFWQAPTGMRSRIEDVVVDETYRGRGYGEKLTQKLIATAERRGAKDIELSSRPRRIVANALYKKMGFEPKETNVYSYKIKKFKK